MHAKSIDLNFRENPLSDLLSIKLMPAEDLIRTAVEETIDAFISQNFAVFINFKGTIYIGLAGESLFKVPLLDLVREVAEDDDPDLIHETQEALKACLALLGPA